jgi:hypothetical protein
MELKTFLFCMLIIFFLSGCASLEKMGYVTSKSVTKIDDSTPLALGHPSFKPYTVKKYQVNWKAIFAKKKVHKNYEPSNKQIQNLDCKPATTNYRSNAKSNNKNFRSSFDMSTDGRRELSYFWQSQNFFRSWFKIQEEEQRLFVQNPNGRYSFNPFYYRLIGKRAINESNRELRKNIPKPEFDFFGLFKKPSKDNDPWVLKTVKKKH